MTLQFVCRLVTTCAFLRVYMDRYLSGLNRWDTLELKRKKVRLTVMYKMSHNLLYLNLENQLLSHTETRTRDNHCFKRVQRIKKDIFKFS